MFTAVDLDQLNQRGDDELDSLVTDMADSFGGAQSAALLFRRLLATERLPLAKLETLRDERLLTPPVIEFLASRQALPDLSWLNRAQIHAGGEFFRRRGIAAFMGLAFASLPSCYCWNVEAVILNTTGRLSQRCCIPRRIPETAQFVLDIGTADAFVPEGIGIQAARKIRLLHAVMRYLLQRDPGAARSQHGHYPPGDIPPWDPKNQGAPISQEFLAATLLTFHYVTLHSMERLGLILTVDEQQDYIHRWSAAGWFLGIEPQILERLRTMGDCAQLYQLVMTRRREPTVQAHALSATLLRYVRINIIESVSGGILNPLTLVPRILTRYLSGKETCAALSMRLRVLDCVLYFPIVLGTRLVGWLDNFPLFQTLTRQIIRYAATHIWRLVHPQALADVPPMAAGNTDGRRREIVRVHPDLAAAWGLIP